MPTPLDRALNQRVSSPTPPSHIEEKDVSSNAENKKAPLFAFGAIVTGIAAWTIWGADIFPSTDPSGDPEKWTHEQCTTWLRNRNLHPSPLATTAELLERVKANMRTPKS